MSNHVSSATFQVGNMDFLKLKKIQIYSKVLKQINMKFLAHIEKYFIVNIY